MKALGLIALLSIFVVSCATSSEVSTQDLRAPFTDNRNEIDTCYTKVMKKQPDIGEGTVEMKFVIDEDGKANKTIFMKKRSTLSNKLLNACIKKVVHNWQFPQGKALDLVYPFTFEKQMASLGSESQPSRKSSPKKEAASEDDEPKGNTELDVIDNSPPEDESESGEDESTPME